jgi:hypothetical protein
VPAADRRGRSGGGGLLAHQQPRCCPGGHRERLRFGGSASYGRCEDAEFRPDDDAYFQPGDDAYFYPGTHPDIDDPVRA